MENRWYIIRTHVDYEKHVKAALVEEILRRSETGTAVPRPKFTFKIGEPIKVVDGPFRDFTGVVETVKPERSRARVSVSVFGRQTPLELDFHQLEAA